MALGCCENMELTKFSSIHNDKRNVGRVVLEEFAERRYACR